MSTFGKTIIEDGDVTRILGNIYIGSLQPIQDRVPLHAKFNITHILSIIQYQTIPEYLIRKGYSLKNIPINDDDSTDILKYLNETNSFIDKCLFPDEIEYSPTLVDFRKKPQTGGSVFIHCHAGVSRSCAFTIAYLMYRYRLSLKNSLYAIKRKRDICQPNDNFIKQLEIFENMGSTYVDENNKDYKQWKLENSIKLDPTGEDILSKDSTFKDIDEENIDNDELKIARCKKCRTKLASSNSFIKHEPPAKDSEEAHFIKRVYKSKRVIDIQDSSLVCSHYFVEPLNWMKEELQGKQELEGKFSCPGCKSKVGGYNWKGSRCSCGKWVVPAVHLQANKVDLFPVQTTSLSNMVNFEAKEQDET